MCLFFRSKIFRSPISFLLHQVSAQRLSLALLLSVADHLSRPGRFPAPASNASGFTGNSLIEVPSTFFLPAFDKKPPPISIAQQPVCFVCPTPHPLGSWPLIVSRPLFLSPSWPLRILASLPYAPLVDLMLPHPGTWPHPSPSWPYEKSAGTLVLGHLIAAGEKR